MPRRVGLPGASELFRPTASGDLDREADAARAALAPADRPARRTPPAPPAAPAANGAVSSPGAGGAGVAPASVSHTGRVRHDEKMTVYVSSEELLALEHLRLRLRGEHGIAVDRGRIVRAALASALAEVHERGADADVVQRLLEP